MSNCTCSEQVRNSWGTQQNADRIHICAFCEKPVPDRQAELEAEQRAFEAARRAAEHNVAQLAKASESAKHKQRIQEVQIYGEDRVAQFEERLKVELEELDYQNWRRGRIPHVKDPEKQRQLSQLGTVAMGTMIGTGLVRGQLSHLENSLDSGNDSTDTGGFLDNLF